MIVLDQQRWWEISEEILDDSAGPIEDPLFEVVQTGNTITLNFHTPQDETWFRLKFTS